MRPKIYADFHRLDEDNRILLTTIGTQQDLQRLGIELQDGMALTFYMDDADEAGNADDIMIDGMAHFSALEKRWVGVVDWNEVYHASDLNGERSANGAEHDRVLHGTKGAE